MKHLIDASSLMLLIKKADIKSIIQILKDSMILDLTFYELGNAVWKETTMKFVTTKEAEKLGTLTQTVIAKIHRKNSAREDFQKILHIAQTEKLTYYDSSYLYFARESGVSLVTEDKELKTKAAKYVNVLKISDLEF